MARRFQNSALGSILNRLAGNDRYLLMCASLPVPTAGRVLVAESDADSSSTRRRGLQDRADIGAILDLAADPRRARSGQVADLSVTSA
jgi:hypothetical protein